jgi:hypothetical protein
VSEPLFAISDVSWKESHRLLTDLRLLRTLSEFRRDPILHDKMSCWCSGCRAYSQSL